MRLKDIWIVFKKEVKDISRDKRTLLISILVPMLVIPLLNIFVGGGIENLQKEINQNVIIALSKESKTIDVKNMVEKEIIKDNENIKLVECEDPLRALNSGDVRLVIDIDKDYKIKLREGKPFEIKILYDKSNTKSEGSIWILSSAIEKFNNNMVEKRIVSAGLDKNILKPSIIKEENVADKTKNGAGMLATFLPIIIVVLLTVGGVPAATDLVAGEKERNTLEPLLTTRPGRISILIGKYMTVTLFSFITVVASVIGIFVGFLINPNALSIGSGEQISGFSIPVPAIIFSIILAIALGMTFAGLQIALSTYAKSFKEAQIYLSFLMIAAMVPAYANMFTQPNDIPLYSFFVPVLNTIAGFKVVLSGNINYLYLFYAFGSSIIHVVLSLAIAVRMFGKEKVLFRS